MVNSMRSFSLNDSVDRGSGSPLLPRAAKNFVRTEQNSLIGRDYGSQAESSPSDKRSIRTESDSFIKQDGHEQGAKSPAWRKPNAFIQGSSRAAGHGEDPFVAARDPAVDPTATSESTRVAQGTGQADVPVDVVGFRPREDRVNVPITADTAQAMLPPNACVFVAKYAPPALGQKLPLTSAAYFRQCRMSSLSVRLQQHSHVLVCAGSRFDVTTRECPLHSCSTRYVTICQSPSTQPLSLCSMPATPSAPSPWVVV